MKLVAGCYSQLPFGTPERELEQLLTNVLKPLLTMLYQKSSYKGVLKLSMYEILWFEENHPEVNMLIDDLVRKKQLELLSGCYYDSLPSIIPAHEGSTQIERTTTYLRKRFSKRSKGLFCYNQNWSSSIVSTMKVCSLDYLVISTWSHSQRRVLEKKPFYMNEMGNTITVFPTDNRYNELLFDFFKNGGTEKDEFFKNIENIDPDRSSSTNTIMLNADQMIISPETWKIFERIYFKFENIGIQSGLFNEINTREEVHKRSYLRGDSYGFDYTPEKDEGIQSVIASDKQLNQLFGRQLVIRDMIKRTKKSTEGRKRIDFLLLQASSGAPFSGQFRKFPPIVRKVEKTLTEIEGIIADKCSGYYIHEPDVDMDRVCEYIYKNKQYFSFLDRKGGSISNITMNNNGINHVAIDNVNFFTDIFYLENGNQKTIKKLYEITKMDKRYNEYFLELRSLRIGNRTVNIEKHYKFRSSTIVLEIKITNISSDKLECSHGICIPLIFTSQKSQLLIPGETSGPRESMMLKKFSLHDIPTKNVFYFAFSEEMMFHSSEIYQNFYTPVGLQKIKMYNNIIVKNEIRLEPGESKTITLGLRLEKLNKK